MRLSDDNEKSENTNPATKRRDLTNGQRQAIYQVNLTKTQDHRPIKSAFSEVADKFNEG